MQLLHVGLGRLTLDAVQVFELKSIFDKAESWLKYSENDWILWTDLTAEYWCGRLEEAVGREHRHFFVCRLDPTQHAGWLSPMSWKWLKERGVQLELPFDSEGRTDVDEDLEDPRVDPPADVELGGQGAAG